MDEEKSAGPGLMASIFLVPHVFGWLVFRPGYGLATRAIVTLYMVLSAIPLYFLIVTLTTSGGSIRQMARDYDRNREVATRNAEDAKGYLQDYEKGDIGASEGDVQQNGNGNRNVDSVELAKAVEKNTAALSAYSGGAVIIHGKAIGDAMGTTAYLQGTETYPAVTLRYSGEMPAIIRGQDVEATCATVIMATAGPELSSCR